MKVHVCEWEESPEGDGMCCISVNIHGTCRAIGMTVLNYRSEQQGAVMAVHRQDWNGDIQQSLIQHNTTPSLM